MSDIGSHQSPALQAGTPAPDFTLHTTPDQSVSLSQFRGNPTILAFYPADFSPVCGDQMALYNQILPEFRRFNAEVQFPNQIPDKLVIADELKGNKIELEGLDLIAVEVGHSDTDHTTCLNVPSIGLVVAGDVAYNDVHQYLGVKCRNPQ